MASYIALPKRASGVGLMHALLLRAQRFRGLCPVLLILVLMQLSACSAAPAATPTPERLRIAGSTSMAPVLRELAAAFQAKNPNVLVEVQGGGSTVGWDELRANQVEMAALSWWDEGETVPEGFRLTPVGRDAVAVIVHARNPISDLTALQVRALFAGEILEWSALSDMAGEPAIVSREDGSGTRAAFEARIMGGQSVTLNALVMPTTQAMVDYVATHRFALGYVTLEAVDDRVRVAPVEGLLPTTEAVRSGAYYLSRLLYLAVPEPSPPQAQAFLDFAWGPVGQEILAKHHASIR